MKLFLSPIIFAFNILFYSTISFAFGPAQADNVQEIKCINCKKFKYYPETRQLTGKLLDDLKEAQANLLKIARDDLYSATDDLEFTQQDPRADPDVLDSLKHALPILSLMLPSVEKMEETVRSLLQLITLNPDVISIVDGNVEITEADESTDEYDASLSFSEASGLIDKSIWKRINILTLERDVCFLMYVLDCYTDNYYQYIDMEPDFKTAWISYLEKKLEPVVEFHKNFLEGVIEFQNNIKDSKVGQSPSTASLIGCCFL